MTRVICILEDDAERRRQFSSVAAGLNLEVRYWHDAYAMVDEWSTAQQGCVAISLDCDLIPPVSSDIWGDGILVAEHLARCKPIAPVIVHSTNRDGSRRMMGLLNDGGWRVHRVVPIGDDWILNDWRIEVTQLTAS